MNAKTNITPSQPSTETLLDVAIIGSGFSGLGMGVALKKAGFDNFTIFEKAASAGGTWRDNTYPGCACDVPSALYSFSFAPNSEWSRSFAAQPEINDYLKEVAEEHKLEAHFAFGHELSAANYDADQQCWTVTFSNGNTIKSRVLISAIGALHIPNMPDFEGLDSFKGETFHSARWNHNYDLTGKRVAVIGTGASAIQFVPAITQQVKALTLFQRSPAWVLPKPDRAIGDQEKSLYRRIPGLMTARRAATYGQLESRAVAFNYATSLLKLVERQACNYIERTIDDPVKARALIPDYSMGCKRILMSNDYYQSLNREHVKIENAGIQRIDGNTIIDGNGKPHEVDAIILGTGFKTLDAITEVDIRNEHGASLAEAWRDGAESHLGCMISGFPNFFMLLGPNTGLGHNSQVYMIESQVRYVSDALKKIRDKDIGSVAVKPAVQQKYVQRIQSRLKHTVWSSGCKSWYLDEAGNNWTLWPGFTFVYRYLTRQFDLREHECTAKRQPTTQVVYRNGEKVDAPAAKASSKPKQAEEAISDVQDAASLAVN